MEHLGSGWCLTDEHMSHKVRVEPQPDHQICAKNWDVKEEKQTNPWSFPFEVERHDGCFKDVSHKNEINWFFKFGQ